MQHATRWSIAFAIGLMLLFVCTGQAASAPYFTWGAMQRFWNTCAPSDVQFQSATASSKGYYAPIGLGTTLNVDIHQDRVVALRVRFNEQDGVSGRRFLHAVATALRVGTYGWPEDKKNEAILLFQPITQDLLTYTRDSTRFTRRYQPMGMWEFSLEYLE